ncbi:MAG: cytochrome c [Acidobacteria bacterium]|nr:MAG: cytochrome c [Acidobacteriota bacterium]
MRERLVVPWMIVGIALIWPSQGSGQIEGMSSQELYDAACARCHGLDGTGVDASRVAFTIATPDFSDCSFSSREPDFDWIAVAHQGGPVRGFDETMPAFGDSFDEAQLQRIIDYIRGFCNDDRWPRGELNLPRPLITEKAYPEDELVFTTIADVDAPGRVLGVLVYENRFGAENQLEVKVPVGASASSDPAEGWSGGLGDVEVGLKRAVFHSLTSILSIGFDVLLPLGDETKNLGKGTTLLEPYIAYGQVLPAGFFLHSQGKVEFSTKTSAVDHEASLGAALGWSWGQGRWGRTWSPMVEVLAKRDLASGANTQWEIVPQMQVTLNTRQHVMLNIGFGFPVTDAGIRSSRLVAYLLWDWFDGGFFDGW